MTVDNPNTGTFVISLDYELMWGVWDVTSIEKYGDNILGVKKVMPEMLQLFELFNIKATFAIVGILFAKNKDELLKHLPVLKPGYSNEAYNVYQNEFSKLGYDEHDDPFHFGLELIKNIQDGGHEIATHTFSHYFCLEDGQTAAEFDADIKASIQIAADQNIQFSSMVFPRNQVNENYLKVLADNGIPVYRGNPESWIYKPRQFTAEVPFIRLCRLLDTYFPVSGNNTFVINKSSNIPINIPASRFLKPYNKKLAWLEKRKLNRIKHEMTYAAKNNHLYHLWWHPHNFGINIEENLNNLTVLLKHFQYLQKKYGFTNCTIQEAAGF